MGAQDDPRGPEVTVVGVNDRPSFATFLTLSCGHVAECSPYFSYRVGERARCFWCGSSGLNASNRSERLSYLEGFAVRA